MAIQTKKVATLKLLIHLLLCNRIYCLNQFAHLRSFDDHTILVSSLKSRQEDAFEYLYDRYSAALYGIVLKIVTDTDEAGDVLQDAFVNISQKIDTYDAAKGTLFTWMLNIARNKALDALRKKERKYQIQLDDQTVNKLDIKGATNSNNQIDTIGLQEIVNNLRPDLKELIELYYFSGFTQQEITDLKGMPLGTVKTNIRTAMQSLRKIFDII